MANTPTTPQIQLFKKIFIHRSDAHARHYGDKNWRTVRDGNSDIKFGDGQAFAHLQGYCRLGVYALSPGPEGTCIWIAADFDEHIEAFEQARKLSEYLREVGIYSLIERSYSGKGYHVWVFFQSSVKGSEARTLMFNALIGTGIPTQGLLKKGDNTGRAMDRLFPTQDYTINYGSQIGLPLQGEAVLRGNCVFIDADQQPYSDQWAKLDEAYDNRVPANHPQLRMARLPSAPPIEIARQASASVESNYSYWSAVGQLPDRELKMRECEAIKASIVDANNFSEPAWQALLSNIAVLGEKGMELAREVSCGYMTFDEEETQKKLFTKIDQLQKNQYPYSCKGLANSGWECPSLNKCPYRFISLYEAPVSYKVHAPDMEPEIEKRNLLYSLEQLGVYSFFRKLVYTNKVQIYVDDQWETTTLTNSMIAKHLMGMDEFRVQTINYNRSKTKSVYVKMSMDEMEELKILLQRKDITNWEVNKDEMWILSSRELPIEQILKLLDLDILEFLHSSWVRAPFYNDLISIEDSLQEEETINGDA